VNAPGGTRPAAEAEKVDGRGPSGFRFQDLRHASAETALDTYAHMWPDSDDSTRAAIDAVLLARSDAATSPSQNARDGPQT